MAGTKGGHNCSPVRGTILVEHDWRKDAVNASSGTRTMDASEFKASCLQLIDEVADGGGEIVITKNGEPICSLVPYRETAASFFGAENGKIKILGDIVSPMPADWFEDCDLDRLNDRE
jgi:prevent-host-death family protein